MLLIIWTFLVCSLNKIVLSDSDFPASPCPNTFFYERTSYNEVHGVAKFKNDFSGYYKLEVNMTLSAFTNRNIGIKRASPIQAVQNGEDIVYHVSFPPSNILPKIASIVFNERLRCSAVRGQELGGYTTLNALHFFSTPITSQGSLNNPYTQSGDSVNFSDPPPQTSTASDSLPNSSSPTSSIRPYIQHVEPVDVSRSPPQTSTTVSTTDGSSSKPYAQPVDPGNTSERSPVTSTVSITIIANRFLADFECGNAEDTQALVVHGTPTSEGQHPWLIAMFHLQEGTDGEYKFKCAANLVSNKHVITAAHCVRTQSSEVLPKDNVILVLGKHNIRSWAVRSEIRNAKDIYVHPEYKQPSDADIAIIIMSKTVEFTAIIQPICLWAENTNLDHIVGSNGTVIGWGKDEFDNAYVPEPKQLKMPIASQEDCLRSDERFLKITSNRTFCAGTRKGEGVCTGDSGGGFVMKRNGKWTLRGVVSSALVNTQTRSCDVNNFMVFSDVTKFMPWVNHIMGK